MAEHLLDGIDVSSGIQQTGRYRVPQRVRGLASRYTYQGKFVHDHPLHSHRI